MPSITMVFEQLSNVQHVSALIISYHQAQTKICVALPHIFVCHDDL